MLPSRRLNVSLSLRQDASHQRLQGIVLPLLDHFVCPIEQGQNLFFLPLVSLIERPRATICRSHDPEIHKRALPIEPRA